MLILLPPSEGKTAPSEGPQLDLSSLWEAEALTEHRRQLMTVLADVSARSDAAATLGLGPSSAADAAANCHLETAPCAPASQLFTGVLYEAAQLAEAPAEQAQRHVLIASGLWGMVRPGDLLPAHRLSAGVTLPDLGQVARSWREPLAAVMVAQAQRQGGLVVDMRSAAYASMWKPRAADDVTLLQVAVAKIRDDGSRQVVSHWAKHMRGVLTGALLRAAASCTDTTGSADSAPQWSPEQVAQCASTLPTVTDVDLSAPARSGARTLTIVTA